MISSLLVDSVWIGSREVIAAIAGVTAIVVAKIISRSVVEVAERKAESVESLRR